jgi:O-antigen ligase
LKEKEFLAYGYLLCMAVVIPWSNALTNLLMVGGVLFIIQNLITNNGSLTKLKTFPKMLLLSVITFLIVILINIFLHSDYSGLDYLKRISSLILLPTMLFIMVERIPESGSSRVFQLYTHSVSVLALGTMVTSIAKMAIKASGPISMTNLAYEELSGALIHHQPIYFSIFVGAAIIFGCWLLLSHQNKRKLVIYYLEMGFLIFFLFLLGSRTAILATFICIGILGVFKSRKLLMYLIISFSLLFFLSYKFIPSFQNRVDYVLSFNTNFDYHNDWSYEGLALRYMTWNCSIEGIKEHIWIGTGITQAQSYLDSCYKEKGYESLLYFKKHNGTVFNSHNVYLDIFLKFGLLGFSVFLILLILLFISSIKDRNILLLLMLIFFIVNGFTESILVREKGILFFAFFFGLLLCIKPKEQINTDSLELTN